MLQFLQCKTFGNQEIPKGWIIVAAGNPPEYNRSVREFDMVTLDRVRRIDVVSDYNVWKEYARNVQVHNALLSYLEIRPKNFYRVEADVDGLQFVTARGWEDLSELLKSYESLGIPMTTDIVHEFLRHGDVAEDVAAYIDLYQKYQDDYGIEEILQGKAKADVYRRLLQAEFDERLSVVNLLFDGLLQGMRRVQEEKKFADAWYLILKEYRGRVEQAGNTRECYDSLLSEKNAEFEQKRSAGLYTRKEEAFWKKLFACMKDAAPSGLERLFLTLQKEEYKTAEEVWKKIQELYGEESDQYEELLEKAGQGLEHAFDFMEEAFAGGEEMVVFVTDLTVTEECALFLGEYNCGRYQKYNKELLIGSRRRELLSELEQ